MSSEKVKMKIRLNCQIYVLSGKVPENSAPGQVHLAKTRISLHTYAVVLEASLDTLWISKVLLIVLGFNDTSTLVGHYVLSPRKGEKRRDSRSDEREGKGRKRNGNESEETKEIKTFPLYPYLLQG